MESEASQGIFCVLQRDVYGTKIVFISFILFFLYFFFLISRYIIVWGFFVFLIKMMRSCGHWTENINLSNKC